MNLLTRLLLPLIVALLVGLPVFWALPETLSFWRSFAIISGWCGYGLLLSSLLLMVRETRLALYLGGLVRMYRWHHRLGILAYLILLLHPLALAADAWNEAPAQAWEILAPWQQGWPVWWGWAALLGMMAGLAAAFSRHLPYAWWRRFHLLLALPVCCAFLHLLLLGIDDLLLFCAPLLALALILWRLLRTNAGLAAQPYSVVQVAHPGKDMIEVTLQPLGPAIKAHPGQFVFAAFHTGPNFHGCGEFHPFSISAIGLDGTLALGIKALGDCSRYLQSLENGVAVRLHGPFGAFLSASANMPSGQPNLWIAGGIGITPFLAKLRFGPLTHPVHLFHFQRSDADAAYCTELEHLAEQQPKLCFDSILTGDTLPDLNTLLPQASILNNQECYLCGPQGLVDTARSLLQARGVPPERIHFESFEFR